MNVTHEEILLAHDRCIAQLRRRSTWYVRVRVALFLLFVAGIGLPVPTWINLVIITVSVVAFFMVAAVHRRVDNAITRHEHWKDIKSTQQARRVLDWEQLPRPAASPVEEQHPFAGDLGLFGSASLHRLLDMSVSRRGSQRLAGWLAAENPDLTDIISRQRRVRALVPLMHFREHLLLEYSMVSAEKLDGDAFLAWLREAGLPGAIRWALPLSFALAGINIALFLLWGFNVLEPWFLLGIFVYGVVYFRNSHVRGAFMEAAVRLDDELGRLKTVFRFLERYPHTGRDILGELTAPFRDPAERPSRHIRGILRDVVAAGVSMNPVLMVLLNLAFPWDFFFAMQLERKRVRIAELLPGWLDTLHELEALQSLANLAALYPDYTFPSVREDDDTEGGEADHAGGVQHGCDGTAPVSVFEAEALGHPLLRQDGRVTNDFRIAREGTLYLVTGSNMSGKSTFLRTVGINLVLAYAGGPVAARSFSTRLFRLYTCIQISDSLREGVSYFYAEVRRLRRLLERLDAGEEHPLFFLIDEIFKGTNNIERHVGGEAYLQALAGKRGTGIVSTHDIDLTTLADTVPTMTNLHFREHIRDGEMRFDYALREGPCPTTNALAIMKLEGLPVP